MQSDDGKMMKFMISFEALFIEIRVWRNRPDRPGQARPFTNPTTSVAHVKPQTYLVATFVFICAKRTVYLCQTDIWISFEMVRSGRKMHSDDGRMIKFMISFGSVTETCF